MIDSHMHINSKVTNNIKEDLSNIMNNNSIEKVINIGLDIETSKESINYSTNNFKVYSSIGIHPLYTENQKIDDLLKIAITDKVVAIGEIGLDSSKPNYNEQRNYLISQIYIANSLHLPVIIHSNNSNHEVIKIFESVIKPQYGCVFHCFQPELDILKYLIDNGYYISFAGRITYKTAKKSIEIAKRVPDELYLVETDSPYISPEPLRDTVNNSSNLKYIIQKISEIKGQSFNKIENQTKENTLRLFKKMN